MMFICDMEMPVIRMENTTVLSVWNVWRVLWCNPDGSMGGVTSIYSMGDTSMKSMEGAMVLSG